MALRHIVLIILALGTVRGAEWIRLASPHFEIYTDANERAGRAVLTRFEQARRVLSSAERHEDPQLRTRVILFSSGRDYATVRPAANVPAFYQSGPDRDYIVMLAGAELDRIILHEYTHAVLNYSSVPLPQWLEEGLADLYSTLSISNRRAIVGAAVLPYAATLAHEKWLTGDQMASVTQRSAEYNEAGKSGVFYAQSWALTHMLTFYGPYRGKLAGFIEALSAGQSQQGAFTTAFGKTFDAALADLPQYIRLGFQSMSVDTDPEGDILFSETAALDPAEAAQSRAEILLLMGRDEEARKIYEDIARRYPKSPAAQTGLAVVALRDRDFERARLCFERAIKSGGRDGSMYFEYAMLLRDTGAEPEVVNRFLNQAIAANPAHAEAHFLLGIRSSDAGRYSDAIEHLRRATEILPRQAYFWQALSYAYHKVNRAPEARNAALRALRCSTTDHETEMARNALKLVDEHEPAVTPKGEAVVTPSSWSNSPGDRRVSGELIEVECAGKSARLHIRTGSNTVVLDVSDPRKVVIRGGSAQLSLACGRQQPVAVLVEFTGATNQVTALQFVR